MNVNQVLASDTFINSWLALDKIMGGPITIYQSACLGQPARLGWFAMDKILRAANKNTTVYFVGAGSTTKDVQKACAWFVSDYTSSNNNSGQQVLMK